MTRHDDNALETAMDGWESVNRHDNPQAWTAWKDWRHAQLKCHMEPENFTVPTTFPPTTVAAAKEYIAVLKLARKAIGWTDRRAKLPTDIYAWRTPTAEAL